MKILPWVSSLALLAAVPVFGTVKVTSPTPGSTVTSPVQYVATATATTCSKGVASMGIYVNNKKVYVVKGASLNTSMTLAAGAQHTVVEEWDKCGGATTETVNLTVTSSTATTVSISANPTTVAPGGSSTLTVSAANATQVTLTGSDGTSYTISNTGGQPVVAPAATTTYTATAVGASATVTATATVTVSAGKAATVTIGANPTSIAPGGTSTLTVTATNATGVVVTGSDGSSYTLSSTGGMPQVSPTITTTYTAEATGTGGNASAETTVNVVSSTSLSAIKHVVFMLQENHSFDNYFGMLNPYRKTHGFDIGDDGKEYDVDGIDDKLTTIKNENDRGPFTRSSSSPARASTTIARHGKRATATSNRYNFLTTRPIKMDGFVHTAQGYATNCALPGSGCSGSLHRY